MKNYNRKYSNENITTLEANEVFVFGSNLAGRHGKGAAKQALKFGAKYGKGKGIQGNSYAIPTKDRKIQILPLVEIERYVNDFLVFAAENPKSIFLVTQIGCGLSKYKPADIAPFFKQAIDIKNILLPKSFVEIINLKINLQ